MAFLTASSLLVLDEPVNSMCLYVCSVMSSPSDRYPPLREPSLELADPPNDVGQLFRIGVPETLQLRRIEILNGRLDCRHRRSKSRVGRDRARSFAQLCKYRFRCARRREQRGPLEEHSVESGLGERWDIGQRGKPLVAPRCQHAKLAGLHMLDHRRRPG